MVTTKTVRRAFSGLTLAFKPKANARITRTLKNAQRHADDAWKGTMHGVHDPSRHKGYGR
ncbi:hypothetical protein B0G80_8967 [Paraburkholderia sp. BL6669N2]|nr:hypothetical protein B0G80_8967 [Paraburkholderia sp. BL6669N2]TDY19895.1 hypothetical protein B0G81_0018 [Paraburkholderia sp. BL6665CI2N2]